MKEINKKFKFNIGDEVQFKDRESKILLVFKVTHQVKLDGTSSIYSIQSLDGKLEIDVYEIELKEYKDGDKRN